MKSGSGNCAPTCPTGYQVMGTFVMTCAGLQYDATGATCQAFSCTGPNANVDAQMNYASCNAKNSGELCEPTCATGYTRTGSFNLACDAAGAYDAAGATCVANTCLNGPFTSCNSLVTGQQCQPECQTGFHSIATFPLICVADTYNTAAASCLASSCVAGPLAGTSDQNAVYTSCSSRTTGQMCTPVCSAGYQLSGSFSLICIATSNQFDASTATCQPLPCTNGPSGNTDVNAIYGSCNSLFTGQSCTPSCNAGYTVVGSFTLLCVGGRYDASGATCQSDTCTNGPSNPNPNANYATCNIRVSGGICAPSCSEGYTSSGSFTLRCISGSYNVGTHTCTPNVCTGGVRAPIPAATNFLPCNSLTTGQVCTPTCTAGYRLNAPFTLNCDTSFTYDSSTSLCEPLPCTGGPFTNAALRANYDSCSMSLTGETCVPVCDQGYNRIGSFPLICTAGTFDAAGAICEAGVCSGGPTSNTDGFAYYNDCNTLRTGEICVPSCLTGYSIVGNLPMVCVNGFYNASGATCQVNSCFNGPTIPVAVGDVTHCSGLVTNQQCAIACPPGYIGTSISVTCLGNSTFNTNGLSCTETTCEGGPQVSDPNAISYQQCNTRRTGDTCRLQCRSDYTVVGTIQLLCDVTTKMYDASSSQCVPNRNLLCNLGVDPLTENSNATYSTCSALYMGQSCSPQCNDGYTKTSGGSMTLNCPNGIYNDTSGTVCTPNSCSAGPLLFGSDLVLRTSYASCDLLSTGMRCLPICGSGYNNAAVTGFDVQCMNNNSYIVSDASKCQANSCFNGPSWPLTSGDVAHCSALVSGQNCDVRCAPGYVGSSIEVECSTNSTFNPTGLTCVRSTCEGGPTTPDSNTLSYDQCNRGRTGDFCRVQCRSGFTVVGTIELLCNDITKRYDNSGSQCVSNSDLHCRNGPTSQTASSTAVYTECTVRNTGDVCTPQCQEGYTRTAGGSMNLFCINGSYNDTSGITCVPNSCSAGPLISNELQQSYANCDLLVTGNSCTPSCSSGYSSARVVPFSLVCYSNGTYVPSSATCEANLCSAGPIGSVDVNTLYTSCLSNRTGDTCVVQCSPGYIPPTTDFTLECSDVGQFSVPTGSSCTPQRCFGGALLNINGNIDYSRCNTQLTGTQCVPTCNSGQIAGSISLVCDAQTGSFDAAGASCLLICDGMGTVCPPPGQCQLSICSSTQCSTINKADGTSCNDNVIGTTNDVCSAGVCSGTDRCVNVVCPSTTQCQQSNTCNPITGLCTPIQSSTGTLCDDGNLLTKNDVCLNGECRGTSLCDNVTCAAISACHGVGTCSPSTGLCSQPLLPTGTTCNDNNPLTSQDQCYKGVCTGILVCSSGACPLPEPCHAYNCINSLCVHTQSPNGNTCNDNVPETRNDMCTDGVCRGDFICDQRRLSNQCRIQHNLLDITDVNQQCVKASVCDYNTGIWTSEFQPNGLPCDDYNSETINDSCQQGICRGSAKCTIPCTARTSCHTPGQCDPRTGSCSNPRRSDFSSCDDGNAATVTDVCISGVCSGSITCGSLTNCRAVDECHFPQCDQNRCIQLQRPDLTPCLLGTCRSGICTQDTLCNGASCKAPSQCHVAACNSDGMCVVSIKINTSPCDDGNAATINDACFSGVCCGESLCASSRCPPASSCHDWGTCNPSTGECTYPLKTDGVACDDGQSGSVNDVCQLGRCVGRAGLPCSNVQVCSFSTCEVPICNGTSTSCVTVWSSDGSFCSSDSSDSIPDTCISGTCIKTNRCANVVCSSIDQCHAAGTCNQNSGFCSTPKLPDRTPCDDGNPLTNRDMCTGGICLGSLKCAGVQCPARNNCNNAGQCDPFTGLCAYTALPDGTTCDDGNPATSRDSCRGGYCAGELQCGNTICISGGCNSAVCIGNSCTQVPVQNGMPCNDNNQLTDNDTCQSGVCVGSSSCSSVICSSNSVNDSSCHTMGECDPSTGECQLQIKPDNSICNDSNPNTISDRCKSGACFGSSRCYNVTCSPLSQCHYSGNCNPASGLCSNPKRQDGTSCDDGNSQTTNDRCTNGKCSGQVACSGSCSTNAKCRDPVCVQGGCSEILSSDGTLCDDDNDLTQNDKCTAGVCAGETLCKSDTVCTSSSQCHRPGECNPLTGICSNPVTWNGKPCDDVDGTTENDICWNGVCAGTKKCSSVLCRASDECHLSGTCNDFTGLCTDLAKPDQTTCDDSNSLTSGDVCRSGNCRGTLTCGSVVCPDPISDCSYVACNGTCTELSQPDGTICNDANPRTINDKCVSGSCRGEDRCANTTCGAIDQCLTRGECNAATGKCEYSLQPDGTRCDDKTDLTIDDVCSAGVCRGDSLCMRVTCAAADSCHSIGVCSFGVCSDPILPDGSQCDDRNPQTSNDVCFNGICSGTLQCGAIQCRILDSQCQQSTCSSQSTCGQIAVLDGTQCSDGFSYTTNDNCRNGICVGTSRCNGITCNPVSQCHDSGSCQDTTGICTTPVKTDGQLCDDGDATTTLDTCQSGICIGSVVTCQSFGGCVSVPQLRLDSSKSCPSSGCTVDICCVDLTLCNDVVCTASDSCHLPGVCDPFTGLCSDPLQVNGIRCHAGISQPVTALCQLGVCTGSIQCGSNQCTSASQCQIPTCQSNSQCGSINRPDNSSCNDNNATTTNDVCLGGICTGMDKCMNVVCRASDQCHEIGTCRSSTGLCSDFPKAFGTLCDDNNPETTNDQCVSGTCTGTSQCSTERCTTTRPQCWYPSCSGSVCRELQKPDNTPCNDNDDTTLNDICTAGTCSGTNLCSNKYCPPKGQCYESSTCALGICVDILVSDYTACDDGNANTFNDSCSRGTCVGIEKCFGTTCPTPTSQCELSNSCNSVSGLCESTYATDGTLCNDGVVSTTGDRCLSGLCLGEISCGVGTCGSDTPCKRPSCLNGFCSVINSPDSTVCNDQNPSTTSDVCLNGVCRGVDLCENVVCGAASFFSSPLRVQCFNSMCNPITGLCELIKKPNFTPCNDNSGLTRNDYCNDGVCIGESICDQSSCTNSNSDDQCLQKTCNFLTGGCDVTSYPDGITCNDQNANTIFDACYSGVCKGRPVCSTTCPVLVNSQCSSPVCRNGLQCTYVSDPDGVSCFMSNTKGICDNGVCIVNRSSCSGIVCYPESQCHHRAYCNNGVCRSIPKPNLSPCDISIANGVGNCIDGVCVQANLCTTTSSCQQQTRLDSCQITSQQCDPLTGNCQTERRPDGFLCNDGNPQTQADRCISGNCVGVTACGRVSCFTTESCRHSRCVVGSCVTEDKSDGSTCDDQNDNTTNDICQRGVCTGQDPCSGIDCSTQIVGDSSCASSVCVRGICVVTNTANNTICDDGNPDTTSDRCSSGICRGELKCGRQTCQTNDQCHITNGCNTTTGLCTENRVADNTVCDDGNPSTTTDICISGQCIGSAVCAVFCRSPSTCMTAVCNGNSCSYIPVTNGVTCTDEDSATTNDVCTSGVCTGTPICSDNCAVTLPETQCMYRGECDYNNGQCRQFSKSDNTSCDDGNSNTITDSCSNGMCVGIDFCETCSRQTSSTCVEFQCVDNRNQLTGMIIETSPKKCTLQAVTNGVVCSDNFTDTTNDMCTGGSCQGQLRCNGVLCDRPQSQCHLMVCSSSGCLQVQQPDQSTCTFLSTEGVNGRCVSGVCVSQPACDGTTTCNSISQCHGAGECIPLTGMCSTPMLPDHSTCNDGSAETYEDKCLSGVCRGTHRCQGVVCTLTAVTQCHLGVACNPMTGLCELNNRENGSPCNDNNPSTINDRCTDGVCSGQVQCVNDLCDIRGCQRPICLSTGCDYSESLPDNTPCDDSNSATSSDRCMSSVCVGTDRCSGVTCQAQSQCHSSGICLPSTGLCSSPILPNDTPCDDSDGRTQLDTCQNGICTGKDLCFGISCPPSDQCHETGVCDPLTGLCSDPQKGEGTPCDDNNAVTDNDKCTLQGCAGNLLCGTMACTASGDCVESFCNNNVCSERFLTVGTTCNDNNPTTLNDTCNGAGVCIGSTTCDSVTCVARSECKAQGICLPSVGICTTPNKPDGSQCSGGDGSCVSGTCILQDKCQGVVCTASDQCHLIGTCDPQTGLCSDPVKPDDLLCDDLDTSTTSSCQSGSCIPTLMCGNAVCTAPVCHDVSCSASLCITTQRQGTRCNDNNILTFNDTCVSGQCIGTRRCEGVTCLTSNPCLFSGSCNPASGVCDFPQKLDGTQCGTGMKCITGECVRNDICGTGTVCLSSSQCHEAGPCTPRGECSEVPRSDSTPCDDENSATVGDSCRSGLCVGTTKCGVSCPVSNSGCHMSGICNNATGLCYYPPRPDGTVCDDGNPATFSSICSSGNCIGTTTCSQRNCTVGTACRIPVCQGQQCTSSVAVDGTICDDNDNFTSTDTCTAGVCGGINNCEGVTCTAIDSCHQAGTCDLLTGLCSAPLLPDNTPCSIDASCVRGVCRGFPIQTCATFVADCQLVENPLQKTCRTCNSVTCCRTCSSYTVPCASGSLKSDHSTIVCNNGGCDQETCCNPNRCQGVTCIPSDSCHSAGVCNDITGVCSDPIIQNNEMQTCDDRNPSTINDTCVSGICTGDLVCGGTVCRPISQCYRVYCGVDINNNPTCLDKVAYDGTPCDDSNALTENDKCTSGICIGTDKCRGVICTPNSQCQTTPGTCNPLTGLCVYTNLRDGTPCDDSNPSTTSDACTLGVCRGYIICGGVPCRSASQCHDVSCSVGGQCVVQQKVTGYVCNDQDESSTNDECTSSGRCVGTQRCNPLSCSSTSSDSCHDPPICDPKTGLCTDPVKPDGTICDTNKVCVAGACSQSSFTTCGLVVCRPVNPHCYTVECVNNICVQTEKFDGSPCNDDSPDTVDDRCISGRCTGTNLCASQTCPVNNLCQKSGRCDVTTGLCIFEKSLDEDANLCNDNNPDTENDICRNGVCSGTIISCQTNICRTDTQCQDVSSTGVLINKPSNSPCDDNNHLTTNDKCNGGICVGTEICSDVSCFPINQCHSAGVCRGGKCTNPIQPEGTPCNDNNQLTTNDVCRSGQCVGSIRNCQVSGRSVECIPTDPQCKIARCDQQQTLGVSPQSCYSENASDGIPCDDFNSDTINDICRSGVCIGSDQQQLCSQVTCSPSTTCKTSICNNGICIESNKPHNTDCSDGNPLTTRDRCIAGICKGDLTCSVGASQINCEATTKLCYTVKCGSGSGLTCVEEQLPDNTECDDGDGSTVEDKCQSGICVGVTKCDQTTCSTPPSSQSCLRPSGVCAYETGACEFSPADTSITCDDGNSLTTLDHCQGSTCTGSIPCGATFCVPNNAQCGDVTCNPSNNTCGYVNAPNGKSCNDYNSSTVQDGCQNGICIGRNLCEGVVCNTVTPCGRQQCDYQSGMCKDLLSPDSTPCLINNTVQGSCRKGICLSLVTCDNVSVCTIPTSNDLQCVYSTCVNGVCVINNTPDNTPCTDGNPATVSDICMSGRCSGITACDSANCEQKTCMSARCTQLGVCVYDPLPDRTVCSDINPSTVNDSCLAGVCVGTAVCSNQLQCSTQNTCLRPECSSSSTTTCSFVPKPNSVQCDDGNSNTINDKCQTGICQGTNLCTDVTCVATECQETSICDYATGSCRIQKKINGELCSNTLIQSGYCGNGICIATTSCGFTGGVQTVCNPPNSTLSQCKIPTCDINQNCVLSNAADHTKCDDENELTSADECISGSCIGITNCQGVSCPTRSQCRTSGVCNPTTGTCEYKFKSDGEQCNDDNPTTTTEVCLAGQCISPSSCGGDLCVPESSCFSASCVDNNCIRTQVPEGTPCDDSSDQTHNDICRSGGICEGFNYCNPNPCFSENEAARTASSCLISSTCRNKDGICIREKKPDGESCQGGICTNGICISTTDVQCQQRDAVVNSQVTTVTCPRPQSPCVKYTCGDLSSTAGGCVETAIEINSVQNSTTPTACDDGNLQTTNDICNNKICVGTDMCSNVSCTSPPTNCNNAGTCIPSTGMCEYRVKMSGSPCKTVSNTDGTCLGSVCLLSLTCNGITCPPYDVECSRPLCNPGCSTAPLSNGLTCSNGVCTDGLCTSSDLCRGVVCQSSSCRTRSFCDIRTGLCSGTPAPDGTSCDDNDIFTSDDQCKSGVCMGTVTCGGTVCPLPTSPCQYYSCNSTQNCIISSRYEGSVCSSRLLSSNEVYKQCTATGDCRVPDSCRNVVCPTPTSACIRSLCEPTTGKCVSEFLPERSTCRVNSFEGVCRSGGCSRLLQCNGAECVANSQCNEAVCVDNICIQRPLLTTSCDDNSPTTVSDMCNASLCVGVLHSQCTVITSTNTTIPKTCEAISQCHSDGICIEGQCTTPLKNDGTPCNDNNNSTLSDVCLSGVCTAVARCTASSVVCVPNDRFCGSVYCNSSNQCVQSQKSDGSSCNQNTGRCIAGICATAATGDECVTTARCGTGQYCVDTNLTSTIPTWECRCSIPSQGTMLLGAATCVTPSSPESNTIIITSRTAVARPSELVDAIAKELGVSPTKYVFFFFYFFIVYNLGGIPKKKKKTKLTTKKKTE